MAETILLQALQNPTVVYSAFAGLGAYALSVSSFGGKSIAATATDVRDAMDSSWSFVLVSGVTAGLWPAAAVTGEDASVKTISKRIGLALGPVVPWLYPAARQIEALSNFHAGTKGIGNVYVVDSLLVTRPVVASEKVEIFTERFIYVGAPTNVGFRYQAKEDAIAVVRLYSYPTGPGNKVLAATGHVLLPSTRNVDVLTKEQRETAPSPTMWSYGVIVWTDGELPHYPNAVVQDFRLSVSCTAEKNVIFYVRPTSPVFAAMPDEPADVIDVVQVPIPDSVTIQPAVPFSPAAAS